MTKELTIYWDDLNDQKKREIIEEFKVWERKMSEITSQVKGKFDEKISIY